MKKSLAYLVTAGLAISLLSTETTYAAGPADSNATVNFTAPDAQTVGPVNPRDPSQPNTNEPGVTGNLTNQTGPLSLDYVSHIDFGDQVISTSEEVYESTTLDPYIQVTDVRGTGAGWSVTAQASNFIGDDDTISLPGSSIQLNNGDTASTSGSDSPVVENAINLVTGGDAVDIVSATPRLVGEPVSTAQGLGTWVTRWLAGEEATSNGNVTLTVPGSSATAGTHSSTITWTLSNGPGTAE